MLVHLRPALACIVLFTLLLGLAYPLTVTGVAQLAFPHQADGSLFRRGDRVIGSALVGQAFSRPEYLHPRPSAAGDGYDASASSGSNLGPLSPDLAARVAESAAALRSEAPGATIPADAVTTSGSGLDPHVSPEFAVLQAPRIARARGVPIGQVRQAIRDGLAPPLFGFIGRPHVHVLTVNLALDERYPLPQAAPNAGRVPQT